MFARATQNNVPSSKPKRDCHHNRQRTPHRDRSFERQNYNFTLLSHFLLCPAPVEWYGETNRNYLKSMTKTAGSKSL
jgi:hypothetical protein